MTGPDGEEPKGGQEPKQRLRGKHKRSQQRRRNWSSLMTPQKRGFYDTEEGNWEGPGCPPSILAEEWRRARQLLQSALISPPLPLLLPGSEDTSERRLKEDFRDMGREMRGAD